MNKSELVEAVASGAGVGKREAESVLDAYFETVKNEVKSGGKVAWPGFGAFSQKQSNARTGRNPQTGAPVKIKASKGVKFSPSSTLKEYMNSAKKAAAKKAAPAKKSTGKAAAKKSPAKKAPAKKAAKR